MPLVAKPVASMISDSILDRLEGLTGATFGAYVFPNVVRPTKLATYNVQHGTIVLTRGDAERLPELDCPGNPAAIAWRQTYLIRVHIAPSELDELAVEVYEDLAEAAIHAAVVNDIDTWYTFEDHAILADFGPIQTTTADGGYEGIAVPLMVTYRVSEGDNCEVRA